MTRSERWIYVGVCLVLYALAMGLLTWAIREPTQMLSAWLGAKFGQEWSLVIVCAPVLAGFIWALWPDPSYTPPPAANAAWPRWLRIASNLYLAAIAFCVVVGMGTFIAVSLMR